MNRYADWQKFPQQFSVKIFPTRLFDEKFVDLMMLCWKNVMPRFFYSHKISHVYTINDAHFVLFR